MAGSATAPPMTSRRDADLVACSVCGSAKVEKQLMAPGIPAKSNRKDEVPQKMVAGPVDPRLAMMMEMMREMRKHVEENADYVGDKFAEEARKIHYDETEARGIYGEATAGRGQGADRRGHRGPPPAATARRRKLTVPFSPAR